MPRSRKSSTGTRQARARSATPASQPRGTRIHTLDDLQPDPLNANRGTDRGRDALRRSLEEHGAGRSIVVDARGRILGGNKTVEQAKALGRRLGGWCEISPCGPKWRFATTRSIICRQVTGNLSSSWPKGRSNGFTKELSRGTDCALPSTMHGSAVVCTSDETPIVGFWTNIVTVEPRRAVRPRRLFLSQRAYSVVPRIFETGYAASRGRL